MRSAFLSTFCKSSTCVTKQSSEWYVLLYMSFHNFSFSRFYKADDIDLIHQPGMSWDFRKRFMQCLITASLHRFSLHWSSLLEEFSFRFCLIVIELKSYKCLFYCLQSYIEGKGKMFNTSVWEGKGSEIFYLEEFLFSITI